MRTMHMLHTLDVEVGRLGSTVRSGFKWADLKIGESIELCVCEPEHDIQGAGVVDRLWFGYFEDIPAKLLSYEHEVRSREYRGLLDSMRKAYGAQFGEHDPVTVVVYGRFS